MIAIIKDKHTGKVSEWSIDDILYEINRDTSDSWSAYTMEDWKEGWYEWVEGEYFELIEEIY